MRRNWKRRQIPLADDELQLLSLFLDAVGREHGGDAVLETEQKRLEARESGRLSPSARLAPDAPAEILAFLGNDQLERVLGMAGCTRREGDAITMAGEGASLREIQVYLGRERPWRNGMPDLSLHTAEKTLYRARSKLRRLLREEQEDA